MSETEKLSQLKHDIATTKTGKDNIYYRHFILHELGKCIKITFFKFSKFMKFYNYPTAISFLTYLPIQNPLNPM